MADGGPITDAGQRDKYIGLALAISSSLAIGSSFIITKKGLIDAADRHGGIESYSYLKNGLWWMGMMTMVVGELANFAAYTFAPPILVTPLGALSVLIGAVLASFFLNEKLGRLGVSGCSLCLVGSVIIVLHAPEDREVTTVDEILGYALQPGFMVYVLFVLCFCIYMIYWVAPKQGNKNPLVYVSICSLAGSVSIMAVKGFGVALKLTFAGNNQLWRPGTWVFAAIVVLCIATQMNYLNKALDLFPTNVNISHENEGSESDPHHGHTLLPSGPTPRLSLSTRLSMDSAVDEERALRTSREQSRRSTTLYRGAGAMMGGVEPVFDYYEYEEGVLLERLEETEDESEGLVKPGARGGGGAAGSPAGPGDFRAGR